MEDLMCCGLQHSCVMNVRKCSVTLVHAVVRYEFEDTENVCGEWPKCLVLELTPW
jgi:hypothetical protein